MRRLIEEWGIDVRGLEKSGQLVLLDARQTLDTFMVDGQPDAELFLSGIRPLMAAATENWQRALRIYGEMVDLLWRDGNHGAAIELEETWNVFAKATSTRTLCGYSMDSFVTDAHAADFARLCQAHTDVQPAGGSSQGGGGEV